MIPIKRALISVSDKTGLEVFAKGLVALGVQILSTGGTARQLQLQGIEVTDVSDYTEFPEMLDGRVKTLHPKIHGGLLGLRDHPGHRHQMVQHGIEPIDMVVVNLYPFEATVANESVTLEAAIEQIDIGGPSMLRSAAKNYRFVTVITDPALYPEILSEMQNAKGVVSAATNARLARQAFARTAAYDAAISNWLSAMDESGNKLPYPATWTTQFHLRQPMRYGENPHQKAAFYVESRPERGEPSVANARQLQGKELSFNNIHDANGAFELIKEFQDPAMVIVKHTNPCGVAVDENLLAAYRKARDTDPVSSFGGIIACNRTIDADVAREICAMFVEAIIAPGFSESALEIFSEKKNIRLLETPVGKAQDIAHRWEVKQVTGGMLLQERDLHMLSESDLRCVTKRSPTEQQLRDLLFSWKVVKHVKSNAIVYAKDLVTVGVGAGQMSRVDSSKIAVWKAHETASFLKRALDPLRGSVLASDAFFPFRDGVDAAAQAGAVAVIQPGGSVRDQEVIDAANEHNMAMIFTGVRHFKH
ncbi:MAG: bifunctional phosphoribosylaminoimidazolecarboxamide formyltransferase/IMP cyclohydrolase [Magnetococcus sp. DMHC-6]